MRCRPIAELRGSTNVDDQWVVGRPILHSEDPPHGVRVRSVGGKSVHRLCRNSYQPAGA